jgi:predicted nucleotidyltransferase
MMRLTDEQIDSIRHIVREVASPDARARVFGSRLRDDLSGGDLDLLVELSTPVDTPAELAARLSARISRSLHGRSVDVLLLAPNLRRLAIHDIALRQGQPL